MDDHEAQAQPAVERLLSADTDALYLELGKRLQGIRRDPAASGNFDMDAQSPIEGMGPDQLRGFGRRFFDRMSRQLYELICGADAQDSAERENLASAFGLGRDAVAPSLALLFVGHLGLAPAIATVIAVLVVKLFFRPGYDAMCEIWKNNLTE